MYIGNQLQVILVRQPLEVEILCFFIWIYATQYIGIN